MRRVLGQYLQAWAASLCLIVASALAFAILAAAITLEQTELPKPAASRPLVLRIPDGERRRPEPKAHGFLLSEPARPKPGVELTVPR